jgi:hypothetical protein
MIILIIKRRLERERERERENVFYTIANKLVSACGTHYVAFFQRPYYVWSIVFTRRRKSGARCFVCFLIFHLWN